MFLRLIKTVLNVERRNESLREMLWSHKSFSIESAFEHLDRDSSNSISAEEFDVAFKEAELPVKQNLGGDIVNIMQENDANSIDMREFAQAVTPLDPAYRRRQYQGSLTFDEKYMQTTSWVTAFYDLAVCMEQGKDDVNNQRGDLKINGESIFEQMDSYRMGYVTSGQFQSFVSHNCGFELSNNDLALIVRALDGCNGQRIARDRFLEAVCCAPEENPDHEQHQPSAK